MMGSEDAKGAKDAKDAKEDDYSDLLQTTRSSGKIQDLVKSVQDHFDIDSLQEQEGLAKIDCPDEVWKVLEKVKEEFKKDWQRSKKVSG